MLHHGGGYTGLSFAFAARALRTLVPTSHVLSFDCRGHGQTRLGDKQAEDELSVGALAQDLVNVVKTCYPTHIPPEIILVGHRYDPFLLRCYIC